MYKCGKFIEVKIGLICVKKDFYVKRGSLQILQKIINGEHHFKVIKIEQTT